MELNEEEIQAIRERCKESNKGWLEGGLATFKCPVCQKHFVIHDIGHWVYKRRIYKGKKSQTLYICSYPCLRKFDSIFGI